VQTVGLGKRYGSLWALQDCSVTVPVGGVTALIGPNGAGKTTLLKIFAGLSRPSAGEVNVLGRRPGPDAGFLDSIGYLAQGIPLYWRLTAGDHLRIFARLNRHWDAAAARDRLAALKVPLTRPLASLSVGSGRKWASVWRWPNSPGCCCWTSPSPHWTRWPAPSSPCISAGSGWRCAASLRAEGSAHEPLARREPARPSRDFARVVCYFPCPYRLQCQAPCVLCRCVLRLAPGMGAA
jgi:energy-coupling factor transporter ATP-binding protein EcfA2